MSEQNLVKDLINKDSIEKIANDLVTIFTEESNTDNTELDFHLSKGIMSSTDEKHNILSNLTSEKTVN